MDQVEAEAAREGDLLGMLRTGGLARGPGVASGPGGEVGAGGGAGSRTGAAAEGQPPDCKAS